MLVTEIAVYSENHTKHINTRCGQNADFLNDTALMNTAVQLTREHKAMLIHYTVFSYAAAPDFHLNQTENVCIT